MITQQDFSDLVSIEMNPEEIYLLIDLLRVETVFQIRESVSKENQVDDKVSSILKIFETYRNFEDRLKSMCESLIEANKSITDPNVKVRNMVLTNRASIKLYRLLCIKTSQAVPPEVEVKFEKLGADLLVKIEKAMTDESVKNPNEDATQGSDLQINILGNKALA